jgi:xylan 1,4-beta-xylosidase
MSYWTFTDIFEELGQSDKPFHGGFGLMTIDNLKKPTYFAYKYLNQLGDIELKNADASSYVCKKGNDVQALFWDFSFSKQNGVGNDRFYTKDTPSLPKGKTTIKISNLKNGKYTVELYKTGYKQNDIFNEYLKIGKPEKLSSAQIEQLTKVSQDLPFKAETVHIKNGDFVYEVNMNENDVYFLKLSKK